MSRDVETAVATSRTRCARPGTARGRRRLAAGAPPPIGQSRSASRCGRPELSSSASVGRLQERLILALELLLEDDAADASAIGRSGAQRRRGTPDGRGRRVPVRAPWRCRRRTPAGAPHRRGAVRRCDDVATAFGEGHDRRALAADDVRHGADETQRTEGARGPSEHVEALVWSSQFVCRDDAEGADVAKRPDLGAAQRVLPAVDADALARSAPEEDRGPG